MVDTSLELECRACGETFWYSGERKYPDTVECPGCGNTVKIPEEASNTRSSEKPVYSDT